MALIYTSTHHPSALNTKQQTNATRAEEDLPHDASGRLLRPGVVWFNERLPNDVADAVEAALDGCDLFLIAGSSAVVYPAAGYAPHVAQRGAPVVEVNLEATPNSAACALRFQGRAGALLPRLLGVEDDAGVREAAAHAAAGGSVGGGGGEEAPHMQRLRVH